MQVLGATRQQRPRRREELPSSQTQPRLLLQVEFGRCQSGSEGESNLILSDNICGGYTVVRSHADITALRTLTRQAT